MPTSDKCSGSACGRRDFETKQQSTVTIDNNNRFWSLSTLEVFVKHLFWRRYRYFRHARRPFSTIIVIALSQGRADARIELNTHYLAAK
jgi:hypothetical protein